MVPPSLHFISACSLLNPSHRRVTAVLRVRAGEPLAVLKKKGTRMTAQDVVRLGRIGLVLAAASAFSLNPASAQTPIKFSLDFKFEGPAAPFVVAIDKGYFKAEGLDVTIDTASGSLEPANDVTVLLMAEYGIDLNGNTIMVNPKFAAEKPEAVKGFMRAFIKGLNETVKNPTSSVESVLKRNDVSKKETELQRLQIALKDNILTPEVKKNGFGGVEEERLDKSI